MVIMVSSGRDALLLDAMSFAVAASLLWGVHELNMRSGGNAGDDAAISIDPGGFAGRSRFRPASRSR
jgi:hypothetical protein